MLTSEERKALDEFGYVHLRTVDDARQVEAMRAAWERLLAEQADPARGNNDGPGGLELDPAFAGCLADPRVMAAVAQVLGGDVALLSFRGREPAKGGGGQGLHVDDSRPAPPERQRLANAFWVLDDMDEANGATRLVPASHRLQRMPGPAWSAPSSRHPDARSLAARAGDVIVFSAHVWHAGSKNLTGARRRVAIASFGRAEMIRRPA